MPVYILKCPECKLQAFRLLDKEPDLPVTRAGIHLRTCSSCMRRHYWIFVKLVKFEPVRDLLWPLDGSEGDMAAAEALAAEIRSNAARIRAEGRNKGGRRNRRTKWA